MMYNNNMYIYKTARKNIIKNNSTKKNQPYL